MNLTLKIANAASMAAAGLVAGKIVEIGWKAITGHPAPTDPDDPQVTFAELAAFAVVSGALLGLARMVTQRSTHRMLGRVLKKA